MRRLFICGIAAYESDKIQSLVERCKIYVDGFVWCVDEGEASDPTYKILEANKGEGKIVRHKFRFQDTQRNEWLHCDHLNSGDWCWIFDANDAPTDFWLQNIKKDIKKCEEEGIGSVFCSGRPWLFKFYDHQFFNYHPHWSLSGLTGNPIVISENQKQQYIINHRDNNPDKHYQEHDTKNYLKDGRTNQIAAFYGKYGQEVVTRHENIRLNFREHLRNKFKIKPGLESADLLFQQKTFNDYEQDVIELEFCLSEYFQRTVLKMDFMSVIAAKRYKWSFKNYLKTGDGFSDPNYKGTILKYDQRMNSV